LGETFDIGNDITFDFIKLPDKTWLGEGTPRSHHIARTKVDSTSGNTPDLPLFSCGTQDIPTSTFAWSQSAIENLVSDSPLKHE
jgi:hypothetical protein